MPYPSIGLQQKNLQNIKQIQRLIMSPQMQQAINLLQMPVLDISTVIEAEMQQNPVLEYENENNESDIETEILADEVEERPENEEIRPEKELSFDEHDFEIIQRLDDEFRDYMSDTSYNNPTSRDEEKLHNYIENSIQKTESLFNYLMTQAKETFNTPETLAIAEAIIGNLDASGFLNSSPAEIAAFYHCSMRDFNSVLKEIQKFDPSGVAATSLQESLLLQLDHQGKKKSLAYMMIANHYDDLLHNHIPLIQKELRASSKEINDAINNDISKLELHPGAAYSIVETATIIPDVSIIEEDGKLSVIVNNESAPSLRINHRYMRMLYDETLNLETKDFIKNKIMSAKWLMRNIFQRNQTIERITESLAKRQKDFFLNPNGQLIPLTMKVISDELSLHESTIARAVSNKYVDSPRGLFPLRYFFTNAYVDEKGVDISSNTVRDVLRRVIDGEDKSKPMSDEAISTEIKSQGIPCARRTVAKYRSELNIGNAQQRRKYK